MRKRGDRRRGGARATKETAAYVVETQVALRAGQLVWYVATYPVRLLLRAVDGL